MASADRSPSSGGGHSEEDWANLNSAHLTPRGECSDCGSQFDPDDTFTFRGLHFCTECVSELASWMLDGGERDEPDRYDWAGLSDPSGSDETKSQS